MKIVINKGWGPIKLTKEAEDLLLSYCPNWNNDEDLEFENPEVIIQDDIYIQEHMKLLCM